MTTTPLGPGRIAAGEAAVTSRQGFDLDDLRSVVEVEIALEEYPLADAVVDRALVYRTEELRSHLLDLDQAAAARSELTRALHDGPGVIVITGAIEPAVIGRATEAVDRERIVNAIYPALLRRQEEGLDPTVIACAVVASAEGYAFPTNLDRDVPIGGLTPPSQQDLVLEALANKTTPDELAAQLAAHRHRRETHYPMSVSRRWLGRWRGRLGGACGPRPAP